VGSDSTPSSCDIIFSEDVDELVMGLEPEYHMQPDLVSSPQDLGNKDIASSEDGDRFVMGVTLAPEYYSCPDLASSPQDEAALEPSQDVVYGGGVPSDGLELSEGQDELSDNDIPPPFVIELMRSTLDPNSSINRLIADLTAEYGPFSDESSEDGSLEDDSLEDARI
jgi:hypothetical protein